MKLKSFDEFVNESNEVEIFENAFEEIKKFVDNPYGIGANAAEDSGSRITFRCESKSGRDKVQNNLKKLGIPSKKMSNSMQDKAYKYRYELSVFENETFESFINEGYGDINYKTDKYALVLTGGSIGSGRNSLNCFVGRFTATLIETGDDKDKLVETKKRMNKQLSPGEKSYYGMSYKVIELTPSKVKEIDYLKDYQEKSDTKEVE